MDVFFVAHVMTADLSFFATWLVPEVPVTDLPVPEHPVSFWVVELPVSFVHVTDSGVVAEAMPTGTATTANDAVPASAAAQTMSRTGRRKVPGM